MGYVLTCPRCAELLPLQSVYCSECGCALTMTAAEWHAIRQGRDLLMSRVAAEWGQFIDSLPER